jgi:hypothetical protein
MITRARRSARWGLTWLLLACAAPLAFAWGPQKPAKRARISVLVILASETDTYVDPKLSCIAEQVRRMDPKLKGFRMGDMSWRSLQLGKAETFLVEGQTTSITVQKAPERMDRIGQLVVVPPMMGQITYLTPCGKFLPIYTPIVTKKGEKVFIAVRVQPCPGSERRPLNGPRK